MTPFESIARSARSLPLEERIRLAHLLLEEMPVETREDDDAAAGERGLAAWTASTHADDWSAFYPAELRRRKAG